MQKQDDNQKNIMLAVVLSAILVIGWQMLFVQPKIKDEQDRRAQQQIQQQAQQTGQSTANAPPASSAPAGTTPPAAATSTAPLPSAAVGEGLTREAALKLGARVAIETPELIGSISLVGGRIDDVSLVKYRELADPKSPAVVILSPSRSPNPYYAEFGWLAPSGTSAVLPSASTEWKVESGNKLSTETPVTISWDNGQGLLFKRRISIDANQLFTIEDQVENKSAAPVTLDHRAVISRHGTPKVEGFYILHEGLIGFASDKMQEVAYADILKNVKDGDSNAKVFRNSTGGWLGITDKYWATALIPDQKTAYDGYLTGHQKAGSAKESFQIDYIGRGIVIEPAKSAAVNTNLFAGAKRVKLIEQYEQSLGAKQFSYLVDWGWFYFITKPLFHLIDYMASVFAGMGLKGNFGLAILFVTVLVKAAFFPLANKSYESMAKMKKLQPEMESLRERFKDDKARQQQELMALYAKEKINPMAGCLPVILQIPVFFALYKVLFVTIDMRHAPFYGWVNDLSGPDPTSLFNLFGLIPITLPEFLHVGAWPILMGITMWIQMQLNPQQPDPVQQKVFNWMPVMFTFMLASFPVGLVIYWAWSNVLSLIQQYYINKKNGAEIHLWKNLGIEKWLEKRSASKS